MRIPSREIIESLRKQYPIGARVELIQMDDVLSIIIDKTSYQDF